MTKHHDRSPAGRAAQLPGRFLAATLLLGALAPTSLAQNWTTDVRFANNTPFDRTEHGVATVPFEAGVFLPGTQFDISTGGTLEPFGATWSDGSYRYAKLVAPVSIPSGQTQVVTVTESTPSSTPSFAFSRWVSSKLPTADVGLFVGTPSGTQSVSMLLGAYTIEEANGTSLTIRYSGRVPSTDLHYNLWVTIFSDQDSARFELRVTNSNPASTAHRQDYTTMALYSTDCVPRFRGDTREGLVYSPVDFDGLNVVTLSGSTHFYDGQARDWFGSLSFYDSTIPLADSQSRLDTMLAAQDETLFGVATNWPDSGAYGPFQKVPDAPSWVSASGQSETTTARNAFRSWLATAGTAWEDRPHGLTVFPGATGAQDDFGHAQFPDVFRHGLSDRVEEARYCAGEEAMRPVHYIESNGDMVLASAHPNLVTWYGRPFHYNNCSPGVDLLGKPCPENASVGADSHGWFGKDEEHWSSNLLASAYLLTASFSLREEVRHEAELYKSGADYYSASRAVGRTLRTAAWLYLCTGDAELVTAMDDDVLKVIQNYHGITPGVTGPVKPYTFKGDQQCNCPLYTGYEFWTPWEESILVAGLEACAQVTGNYNAHSFAYLAASTIVNYGWNPGQDTVGKCIRWLSDGSSLSAAQYNNIATVCSTTMPTGDVTYYGPYNEWSVPAAIIASRLGAEFGDPALTAAADNIVNLVLAQRNPTPGAWDRFALALAVQ